MVLLAGSGVAAGAVGLGFAGPWDFATEWRSFQDRHVGPEGRVVDNGNGGISHSEGQSYGLLFAEAADDRAGFERILAWTRGQLGLPGSLLHRWRFRPGHDAAAEDPNNATDGDLVMAWALLRAAARWGVAEHRALAAGIARDILRHCVVVLDGRAYLLPGARGFRHPGRVHLNPSYYGFRAIRALAGVMPNSLWRQLERDGLELLALARFGHWRLPADWIDLTDAPGRPGLSTDWPPRFSWDAVRVPLHLAWAGLAREPALRAAVQFWFDPAHARIPAWVDLRTDEAAPYPASAGVLAVARLAMGVVLGDDLATPLPALRTAPLYYDAALVLLARLAREENRRLLS
ncbi:glycosyl hydrolase family 8 [Paeniroseomonas aquatica]|uniref:Glucanase n=1 Tax=Paeniroseomonas aquatica TaxID=373043 RepID=A0ABT8A7G0_9PROT|nr:glycosyl hydrolase family 8 [Paeniroseomonas aquatica]MDN3565630.1 glycosyl hydrolase family 8 [Paeniroseomonas aquatica]